MNIRILINFKHSRTLNELTHLPLMVGFFCWIFFDFITAELRFDGLLFSDNLCLPTVATFLLALTGFFAEFCACD
jgi:hypothetical protein